MSCRMVTVYSPVHLSHLRIVDVLLEGNGGELSLLALREPIHRSKYTTVLTQASLLANTTVTATAPGPSGETNRKLGLCTAALTFAKRTFLVAALRLVSQRIPRRCVVEKHRKLHQHIPALGDRA